MDATEFNLGGVKLYACMGVGGRDKVVSAALGRGGVEHFGNGAPYAVDANGHRLSLYISITHTEDMCAIALSDTPVGIDAERLDRLPPRGFSDIYSWTDTEAYVKCLGRGLSLGDARRGGYGIKAERTVLFDRYALSVYKS